MKYLVKIVSHSWFSKIPVTSGNNKSFGPVSIDQLHSALQNVILYRVESDIERWIKETGFFNTFPVELIHRHNTESFAGFLSDYNKSFPDFLEENPTFYLFWSEKQ